MNDKLKKALETIAPKDKSYVEGVLRKINSSIKKLRNYVKTGDFVKALKSVEN